MLRRESGFAPRRWLAVLGIVAFSLFAVQAQAAVVQLHEGSVSGTEENGIARYLGIPYARPPVGDRRWMPPQAPLPWQGIRQTRAFAPACAQIGNYYTTNDPSTFDRVYGSEDCLYLNVWSPAAQAGPRPVLVFIHGGSGVVGAASFPLYDGQRLARELGAVVVTINYRLSFLGNLQLEALRRGDPVSDSGSFAHLDKVEALRWVERNVANFGGNPANVTVMGHSAGCVSIWALMRSPLASDLFDKVVCLSGIPLASTWEEAQQKSENFLGELLHTDGLIDSVDQVDAWLQGKSKAQVREYLYSKSTQEITGTFSRLRPVPEVLDGHVFTSGVDEAPVNPVPAIIGNTTEEGQFLVLAKFSGLNHSGMWSLIHGDQENLKQIDFFNGVIDLWKYKFFGWLFNRKLLKAVDDSTDLLASQSVPVYRYVFHWQSMPEPWKSLYGSYHGLDVPFVFGNFDKESPNFTHFTWAASDDEETESIHRYFAKAIRGFIESADPNQYVPVIHWPAWGNEENSIRVPGDIPTGATMEGA